jgi:hypothetical protein
VALWTGRIKADISLDLVNGRFALVNDEVGTTLVFALVDFLFAPLVTGIKSQPLDFGFAVDFFGFAGGIETPSDMLRELVFGDLGHL